MRLTAIATLITLATACGYDYSSYTLPEEVASIELSATYRISDDRGAWDGYEIVQVLLPDGHVVCESHFQVVGDDAICRDCGPAMLAAPTALDEAAKECGFLRERMRDQRLQLDFSDIGGDEDAFELYASWRAR